MNDATEVLQEAMAEYEAWRNFRQFDVSVESFLKEKMLQAKADAYDAHMVNCPQTKDSGDKQGRNAPVRFELVEGTDRA